MKFEEYVKELNELLAENPDYADLMVVTSKDDEGNGFDPVYYGPQAGEFEDGEFDEKGDINAICLN